MPDRFIMPTLQGTGSGDSWENAGQLNDLQDFIVQAGPDGHVYLRAGAGSYEQLPAYNIWSGGEPGHPVRVMGVDVNLNPMHAVIIGDRDSPYNPDGNLGSEGFRINDSADHLTFSYLSFVNIGNGAFRVTRDTDGLTIEDVTGKNVTRLIENNASGSIKATLTNFAFRRITVNGYSRGAIRLRYDSRDGVIEDVVGDSEQQDKHGIPVGIGFFDDTRDIEVKRCKMSNAVDSTGSFWNGDGFSTERNNQRIKFISCSAFTNADAGFDCKGVVELIDCISSGNTRNYKIWGRAVLTDCYSEDPIKQGGVGGASHVQVTSGGTAVLKRFRHTDSRNPPLLDLKDGPSSVKLIDTAL